MLCRAATAAACLILVVSMVGSAQQAAAPQAPAFRAAIDLVHLDVFVLDKQRRPIRGLTAADFTVLEEGKPQSIAVFTAVDVPDVPRPPATWGKTVPHEIQSNQGAQTAEGRLFVLMLDDAMIPNHPGFLASARDIARKVIDRVTPADRVAVVFSATGKTQNFTNDRARLLAAVETLREGHARHVLGWDSASDAKNGEGLPVNGVKAAYVVGPITDPDIAYRNSSVATLRMIAETIIAAPQRRKILILVSPGVEVDQSAAMAPLRVGDMTINLDEPVGERAPGSVRDANSQLQIALTDLFKRMRRANVTIYPIDPCGAGGFRAYVQTAAASMPQLNATNEAPPPLYDFMNPARHGLYRPSPADISGYMSTLSLDFLNDAAKNTGGAAIVNTNDFEAGVDRIFDENSSYYLLGYPQPPNQKPGSAHALVVKVNRPDVIVWARNGYATDPPPKRGSRDVSPLDKAITGPLPDDAFPMRVALAPFVVPGKKDAVVLITLGLRQPAVTERKSYDVLLQTNAYTPEGQPRLIGQRHHAGVTLGPRKGIEQARYDLLSQISLKPGRYELRLSAYRGLDNVQGSLYADVEVPDFANEPLSVSGLVVQHEPADAVAPPGAFGNLIPVTPTSNREFRSRDQATVFFRTYQGGRAPLDLATVDSRIVNDHDVEVGKGREIIPMDQFHGGGRTADFTFTIPVDALPAGTYLLTFNVSMRDKKVTRSMQFTIVRK